MITKEHAGLRVFSVSVGNGNQNRTYVRLAVDGKDAIRRVVKEMAIGRWKMYFVCVDEDTHTTSCRIKGKFVDCPASATEEIGAY